MLFASIVDDPSSCPEKWSTERDQLEERERLGTVVAAYKSELERRRGALDADSQAEYDLKRDLEVARKADRAIVLIDGLIAIDTPDIDQAAETLHRKARLDDDAEEG